MKGSQAMLCHEADRPLEWYEQNGNWFSETKMDGTRVIAIVDNLGEVKLLNRRNIDYTKRLPEVVEALKDHGHIVLDGEMVYFNEKDEIEFVGSQRRCSTSNPKKIYSLMREYPITYAVFDILAIDGVIYADIPYITRKQMLADIVDEIDDPNIIFVSSRRDIVNHWNEVSELDGEGLILKHRVSNP